MPKELLSGKLQVIIWRLHQVNKNYKPQVQLFPNPASEFISVQTTHMISRLMIFNIKGQLIYHESSNTQQLKLEISEFESGLYLIKVETDKGVFSDQLMIK